MLLQNVLMFLLIEFKGAFECEGIDAGDSTPQLLRSPFTCFVNFDLFRLFLEA
jgi:hypothetical protein